MKKEFRKKGIEIARDLYRLQIQSAQSPYCKICEKRDCDCFEDLDKMIEDVKDFFNIARIEIDSLPELQDTQG